VVADGADDARGVVHQVVAQDDRARELRAGGDAVAEHAAQAFERVLERETNGFGEGETARGIAGVERAEAFVFGQALAQRAVHAGKASRVGCLYTAAEEGGGECECECEDLPTDCEAEAGTRPGTVAVQTCPPGEIDTSRCAASGVNCRDDFLQQRGFLGCCPGLTCLENADAIPPANSAIEYGSVHRA
jgi:hypothetical protein